MKKSSLSNQNRAQDGSDAARPLPESRAAVAAEKPRGSKAWLFGAYTFLFLWGVTYLVLLFTNRLPF